MNNTHYILMILIMIGITVSLRFLPFVVFGGDRRTPGYIVYLGTVLPYAIMGMLAVYCLRNTSVISAPHGIPELIAILIVAGLQVWKRNTIISILCGTICYMIMVQMIF